MFPPWQLHSVLPSEYPDGAEGEQRRVSWAFNLMAKKGPNAERSKGPGVKTVRDMEEAQGDLLDGLMDEL